MKRTTATVLALLFASANGIKIGKHDDVDATAVKPPPEGMIGDNVYEHAMNATEGVPGLRIKEPTFIQLGRKHHHHHQKNPSEAIIGTENIDEEVQEFASKHTTGLSQKNPSEAIIGTENIDEEVQEFASKHTTGLSQKHHHRKHHKNPKHPDVAERGMDDEVHGFVADNVSGINEIYHSDSEPSYNGGANSFNQRRKKDIGERGMDPDVHGFVWEAMPPLNTRERSYLPFIPNGSDPSAFKGSGFNQKKHHHHKRPDVAERGMDEEVHGFVSEYTPPIPEMKKSDKAFIPNGSDPSAFDPSFAEQKHHKKHHKKDVAERGMDEEVHGFVWHALPPLNTWVRSPEPFVPNGSDPSAIDPSFAQRKHQKRPDVAERGMDEEVHGFVSEYTPPIPETKKSDKAFIPNGSDPSAFDPSFAEQKHHMKHHKKHHKKDVAERGMDEEVHGFVWHALPPLNTWVRSPDPFVPNGSDPSAIDPDAPASFNQKHHRKHHKQTLSQLNKDDAKAEGDKEGGDEEKVAPKPIGEPEKVTVLNPMDYQEAADNASPFYRTTFYYKKNQDPEF